MRASTASRLLKWLFWPKPLYLVIFITYFVEYFYVSRSELIASSEKPAVTSWISWRNGVRRATSGIRILIGQSVVRYVDVMTTCTKRGSVIGTSVHCVLLILILSQLNRVISFVVIKREDECFTGCRGVARSWNEKKHLKHPKCLGCKETQMKRNCIARKEGGEATSLYGPYMYVRP